MMGKRQPKRADLNWGVLGGFGLNGYKIYKRGY